MILVKKSNKNISSNFRYLLSILFFLIITSLEAQQIGTGLATTKTNFSDILLSGVYTGLPSNFGSVPSGGYQHLFVIRHNNMSNNYQFQLGTSLSTNDRVFFRKIANSTLTASNPPWIEFATRGSNNFNGNQSFAGTVKISDRQANTQANSEGSLNFILNDGYNANDRSRLVSVQNRGFIDYRTESGGRGTWILGSQFSYMKDMLIINGKTEEVIVDGKIKSEEVKVEVIDAPDYVFEENYNLRSLEDTKKYINENKHLPEIPSAKEMEENGVDLGIMNMQLLKKIEELTLYQIDLLDKLEVLNQILLEQQEQIKKLQNEK